MFRIEFQSFESLNKLNINGIKAKLDAKTNLKILATSEISSNFPFCRSNCIFSIALVRKFIDWWGGELFRMRSRWIKQTQGTALGKSSSRELKSVKLNCGRLKLLTESAIHHFPRRRQVQLEACMFESEISYSVTIIFCRLPMEIASKVARA